MNLKRKWLKFLITLQASLNNSKNASTDLSSNKVVYDFNVQKELDLLNLKLKSTDIIQEWNWNCWEAENTLTFANITAKIWYDMKHKVMSFKVRDKVFMKLHQEYQVSDLKNLKLSQQWVGPFSVKWKVDSLIYELKDISSNWKIHLMISVTMLELVLTDEDQYRRNSASQSGAVQNNAEEEKSDF